MQAYNDAFAHFGVRCPPDAAAPLHWDEDFNNDLQSRITGGKPKMRWYVDARNRKVDASFVCGNLPMHGQLVASLGEHLVCALVHSACLMFCVSKLFFLFLG